MNFPGVVQDQPTPGGVRRQRYATVALKHYVASEVSSRVSQAQDGIPERRIVEAIYYLVMEAIALKVWRPSLLRFGDHLLDLQTVFW